MADENPKLKGSNIVDCIPQTGECPHRCPECFYNGGRFYRTLDEPLLPSVEEVGDRIVRVNCGNDSNNQRELVLRETAKYRHKFYNTSVPKLDFPAPVVLTVNPQHEECVDSRLRISRVTLLDPPPNLMFVRVRAGLWQKDMVREVAQHYLPRSVPVVITFMRYYQNYGIPEEWKRRYEYRPHITNSYYLPAPEHLMDFMSDLKGTGVRVCSRPWSSLCIDCGQCEEFFWRTMRRMAAAVQPPPEACR